MATAVNGVYQAIKDGILDREYPPGTYVRETTVADKLAVSRTPIREAIRRLVSDGWLESIPNCGARVVQWTEADLNEVFELRALLEPLVARRAATRLSTIQLERLEGLADAMEKLAVDRSASALDEITALNQQFHEILSQAAESPRVKRILHGVVIVPIARRSFHSFTSAELNRSMQHHRNIIHALAAQDGDWAAAIMRSHILAARAVQMRRTVGVAKPVSQDAMRRKNGTTSRY